MNINEPKPVVWLAGSKKALPSSPYYVVKSMDYAVHLAQLGLKAAQAKPLRVAPARAYLKSSRTVMLTLRYTA